MDASTKMAAARTRLILDKPFLGALALRLPLVEAETDWCQSTWSNGQTLYYNRAYIDALSVEQTQFALSREAMHCALLHFYRRGSRARKLWENACDFAVNPLLIEDGLQPTPDTVHLPEFDGMTAEEIYPLLRDNEQQQEQSENRDSGQQSEHQQSERTRAHAAKGKNSLLLMLCSQRSTLYSPPVSVELCLVLAPIGEQATFHLFRINNLAGTGP